MQPGERTTVLVVDDEYFVRALLVPALTKHGYDVLTASDGKEGMAVFFEQAEQIDLIVTDITMPGLNGVEMIEKIRRIHPGARVLFISGNSDELPAWAATSCGFLLKPFRVSRFMSAVETCLQVKPLAANA
jgi:two-component system cell cycle sensor histidine kinase/response regulator CckA